jgi:secreted trypsin-like serine protease
VKRWIVVGSVVAMWGCADKEVVEGRDLDLQAIYGGSLPTEWFHEATVAITTYNNPKRNVFCSGTLIAPDVVLTAAHCLDEASWSSATYNEYEPGDIKVGFGDRKRSMVFETVTDVEINSGYDRSTVGVDDLGLIRLTNASTVTPVPALPYSLALDPATDIGGTVNFAGFGLNDQGYNDSTKLQVDGTISVINATTVEYEQLAGGPCSGDSGGPMFIDRSGDMYVAGVTSWGSSNCSGNGAFGVSMTPDVYESWIAGF